MSYQQAKERKAELESAVDTASKALQVYPRQSNGLTPDDVKASVEYKADKLRFDIAFRRLQDFNRTFVKQYKNEYAQERRTRRL